MENEQQEGGTVRNSQAKSISGALLSPTYKWWSALCQSLSSVSYAPFNVKRPAMHSITSPKAVIGFSSKLAVWLPYCLTYTNNSYGMSQGCQRNTLEKRILQVSGICRIPKTLKGSKGPTARYISAVPVYFVHFFRGFNINQPGMLRRDSRLLKERWEPGFGYHGYLSNLGAQDLKALENGCFIQFILIAVWCKISGFTVFHLAKTEDFRLRRFRALQYQQAPWLQQNLHPISMVNSWGSGWGMRAKKPWWTLVKNKARPGKLTASYRKPPSRPR